MPALGNATRYMTAKVGQIPSAGTATTDSGAVDLRDYEGSVMLIEAIGAIDTGGTITTTLTFCNSIAGVYAAPPFGTQAFAASKSTTKINSVESIVIDTNSVPRFMIITTTLDGGIGLANCVVVVGVKKASS